MAKEIGKMTFRLGSIFSSIGLLLIIGAISVYFYTNKSLEGTIIIKGKVIGLSSSRTPKVEFQMNNQTYQIDGSVSSKSPAFDVGEEVELFVNPKSPQTASINSLLENWFVVLTLGFIGIVFSTIGISVVRKTLKKKA